MLLNVCALTLGFNSFWFAARGGELAYQDAIRPTPGCDIVETGGLICRVAAGIATEVFLKANNRKLFMKQIYWLLSWSDRPSTCCAERKHGERRTRQTNMEQQTVVLQRLKLLDNVFRVDEHRQHSQHRPIPCNLSAQHVRHSQSQLELSRMNWSSRCSNLPSITTTSILAPRLPR